MNFAIINYSKVKDSTKLFRFDAEYFHPTYLKTENLIKKRTYSELRSLIDLLTDYHANGSYEILRKNVVLKQKPDFAHMIRTVDIERDDFENDIICVSERAYHFLVKTKVYGGEIIINKIGNAGKVYLVPPVNRETTLGMNQFMIRTKTGVDNYCLYCYLAGRHGQKQLSQRITGAVPLSIDKESVKSVLVPHFSNHFKNFINSIVRNHFTKIRSAKNLYSQVNNDSLKELNLSGWFPKHKLGFSKNLSSLQISERVDAEYFQPKFDEIVNHIKEYGVSYDSLDNLVEMKKCIEPGSAAYQEIGIPFIRVSNLSKFEISDSDPKYISENLYSELITHQPKKGEILFTKDATPGIAYYLDKEPIKMIPSGGILRLKIKDENKIKPEYLTLVLNSILVQQQMLRDAGGSIIKHWRPDQIKATLIPILDEKKQLGIQSKLQESFDCRAKSKQLIEIAKRGVEMAIEKDETKAKNWINEEVEKLGVELNE